LLVLAASCFAALVIGALIGALLALLVGQIVWLWPFARPAEVLPAVALDLLAR
jgi:hypothetical protein